MKLRNVSLTRVGAGQLQLVYTVKSAMQTAHAALVARLEENIQQQAAAIHPVTTHAQPLQQQYSRCTLNLLSGQPFTPLRCVRGAAGAGKYRVLCRAVSVWPADIRRWSHFHCARCGDRTGCTDVTAVDQRGGNSGGCRACGARDSRRCEWGFSLILEDATAMLQAEVWGTQAVSDALRTVYRLRSCRLSSLPLSADTAAGRAVLLFVEYRTCSCSVCPLTICTSAK